MIVLVMVVIMQTASCQRALFISHCSQPYCFEVNRCRVMSIQGTERSSTPRKSSPYEGLPPRVPAFRQGPGMPEGSLSSLLNLPASRTLGTCEQMNNMPRAVSTLPSSGSSPGPIHWATPGLEICCGSPELLTGCIPNEESDLGTTDAPESRIGTKMPLSPGCPTSDSTGLNQMYYLTPQAKT